MDWTWHEAHAGGPFGSEQFWPRLVTLRHDELRLDFAVRAHMTATYFYNMQGSNVLHCMKSMSCSPRPSLGRGITIFYIERILPVKRFPSDREGLFFDWLDPRNQVLLGMKRSESSDTAVACFDRVEVGAHYYLYCLRSHNSHWPSTSIPKICLRCSSLYHAQPLHKMP